MESAPTRPGRILGHAALSMAALVFFAAGRCVRAQDIILGERGSTVTGHIEIEGIGGPSERLEVTIQKASGAGSTRIIAEPGGYFFAKGIYPGNYVFSVRPPERMNLSEGSADLTIAGGSAGANYAVTIYLRKKARDVGFGSGRLIAAQENDRSVPKKARKAYQSGTRAANEGKLDEAIEAYRSALSIDPNYLFALNDLGVQYMRARRYAEAVEVLRRAVAAADSSFPPHLNLAIALLGSGNVDEASREVAAALAIDASASDALFLSGVIAKRVGNTDDAISAFRKAYDSGGADAIYAQFELGRLYDAAGQGPAAARAYRLFLQFVQQGPQADVARQRLTALAHG